MNMLEAIRSINSSVVKVVDSVAYNASGDVVEYDKNAAIAAEKMITLRNVRDKKLSETDWWAGSDLTMTQAQTDYRQALRDITDNATSLDDVTWPTKP
tara:strand:- start:281 stop:574 length:294 start_codon:yes stop_codon:yes gene_type:complete